MKTIELKSLIIDVENNIYKLNGENIGGYVSELELVFAKGKWSLQITKDEFYESAATEGVKE